MTGASRFVRSVLNCLGLPSKRETEQDYRVAINLDDRNIRIFPGPRAYRAQSFGVYERATIAPPLAEALRTVEQKQGRRHISDGTLPV